MRIKQKITMITMAFLVVMVVVGAGAFYIVHLFGANVEVLSDEIAKAGTQDELEDAVLQLTAAVHGWASGREMRFRDRYSQSMIDAEAAMRKWSSLIQDEAAFRVLEKEFEKLREIAAPLMAPGPPLHQADIRDTLQRFDMQVAAVLQRKSSLLEAGLETAREAVASAENIRLNMSFYLLMLIGLSLLFCAMLAIVLRRLTAGPYEAMMSATGRVAAGDLSFRIGYAKQDEFGVIARRFDDMVESLERSDMDMKHKLRDTELFLTVSRIAEVMPGHKDGLALMAETIAANMEKDLCALFMYRVERGVFELEACSLKGTPVGATMPVDSRVLQEMRATLSPIIVDDAEPYPEISALCGNMRSFMAVPVLRERSVAGILLLGMRDARGFRGEDTDAAVIVAHTIAAAIRNIELYEETRKQLNQLTLHYELSKALTSVFDTDELLRIIAAETAKLINAKGCVIRLIEDGMLRVRSFSGHLEDLSQDMDVPVGKGLAGWVAREKRPLFVEDISRIPEDMRTPALAQKSAISVPLMKDETILGTLGLYDKVDERGKTVSFSIDDLKTAEGLASLSSIAIDKSLMREQERRITERIEEAKRRMDLLFESVQSGIITMDRSYRITAANKYVERWVDKPLDEILQANAVEVFHRRGGICPHCAAKATFEEGSVNTITQSSGLNYADLFSYPVADEQGNIMEAVVVIQDITDRVLYQEEIMGLYREVMQTKEYMESLISNSADAIVTTDVEGVVESWNSAAEAIFGFTKDEVVGNFLPFVPESLIEFEKNNIDRIKNGEVLKLETFRQRKDGAIIEVSLTLSPIKDVSGEIIGITGITRDITDKKRVEKELIRRNQELSRLFFISSAMRGTLELDKLLRMVLTAVTMSDGLGFNRTVLFFMDEDQEKLKGILGVGPSTLEEAWQVWEKLSVEKRSLRDIMNDIQEGPMRVDSFLDRLSTAIDIPLSEDTVLTRVAKERRAKNVLDVKSEPLADVILIQQLGTEAYAAVPLISRDKVLGVLWVDNLFNKKPITDEDMKFLAGFSDQVASAIESARLFQQVSLAEAELENIFRSISDMVYFTSPDYTLKSVNQAVADKLGRPTEELIGKKCYEVFHGTDEPLNQCPHHKTVEAMKAFVMEVEDPFLKGTFLTSTSPIFDKEENFLGTVHVVRDVSELKALRERVQSAERMAALGEVAAKVAHEIRNPLVSVGGFAKRLEDKLEGNLKEYASIIANEVLRLERILKDILGFVREVRMSIRRVDLNTVLEGTLELVEGELASRQNTLIRELMKTALMVEIDPDRMKEAFLNLLANANQATDRGTITVRTRSVEGRGVLEVIDTGCGIKQEDLSRIFDPFYTTRPTGTGLGLAIAKRIVEEHDGQIVVSSSLGEGTSFMISLPLKEE